jgi:hypothetical protein
MFSAWNWRACKGTEVAVADADKLSKHITKTNKEIPEEKSKVL